MLFSFIIPIFNTSRHIARCADSILKSSLPKDSYEIWFVDDGSTDDSVSIIKKYTDNYSFIHAIYQENRGPGAARNAGMREARGKYIFFVDSDDFLLSENLGPLAAFAENSTLEIILYETTCIRQGKIVERLNRRRHLADKIFTGAGYLASHNLQMAVWCGLFSREFLQTNHFEIPEGIYHEDELFIPLVLLQTTRMGVFPQEIYIHDLHENSITGRRDLPHVEKRMRHFLYVAGQLHDKLSDARLTDIQVKALRRRLSFLSADLIVMLFRLKVPDLMAAYAISQLRECGLFPLPAGNYSWKYNIFRKLTFSEKLIRLGLRFFGNISK